MKNPFFTFFRFSRKFFINPTLKYNISPLKNKYSFGKYGSLLTAALLLSYELNHHAKVAQAESKHTIPKIISKSDVEYHNSVSKGVWMIYNSKVYDVTSFVEQHPGGDKILLGAGKVIDPFWSLYAFHKEPHVLKILDEYYIGDLEELNEKFKEETGPYANDPERHPALCINTKTPFNAEAPTELITDNILTPNEIFFVRNHLPVPKIDLNSYNLELSVILSKDKKSFTLDEIKSLEPHEIITTMQCAGNRRKSMQDAAEYINKNDKRIESEPSLVVHGLSWNHTALSTAKWKGSSLIDVIYIMLHPWKHFLGLKPNPQELLDELRRQGVSYVQFEGADGDPTIGSYGASIPIDIALDINSDIILAYEMNDKILPPDHGFPLRVIIPGMIGARQVKWLKRIILSGKESDSFWQQKDYKFVSQENKNPDYSKIPAILDYPVQSAICFPKEGQQIANEGSITVKGYALSGGGRGILNVEVSADNGNTWHSALLKPANQPTNKGSCREGNTISGTLDSSNRLRKQWAWSLWEIEIPINPKATEVELICKARDSSNAVQPANFDGSFNIRGLLSNAWHRINVKLVIEKD